VRSVSRERQPHGVPKEWDGRSQCTTLAALVRTYALVLVTASRDRCMSLSTSATDAAKAGSKYSIHQNGPSASCRLIGTSAEERSRR